MPTVLFPLWFDKNPLRGDHVYNRLYHPGGASLEVINGRLDRENLAPDFLVGYHSLQANSVSNGGMVAATGNSDFFGGTSESIQGWFDGISSEVVVSDTNSFLPVPGAAVQFYLPFPAYVLLTWEVNWVSDSTGAGHDSVLRLFVDGDKKSTAHARRTVQTQFRSESGEYPYLRDRYKSRYWCGHALLTDLSKGYHSASLRLCANENIKQTRVRARSMKYIIFKRSDS